MSNNIKLYDFSFNFNVKRKKGIFCFACRTIINMCDFSFNYYKVKSKKIKNGHRPICISNNWLWLVCSTVPRVGQNTAADRSLVTLGVGKFPNFVVCKTWKTVTKSLSLMKFWFTVYVFLVCFLFISVTRV